MLAELHAAEIVSRWFHIVAVIVAVGGTVFLRYVLHPTVKTSLPDEAALTLRDNVVRRWARFVHTAILVIILSGTYNLIVQLPRHKTVPGTMPLYHVLLGPKLLLALILFFIAIATTGRSKAFEGMRQQRPKWMAINVLIAALIVLISNVLKNIPPTP